MIHDYFHTTRAMRRKQISLVVACALSILLIFSFLRTQHSSRQVEPTSFRPAPARPHSRLHFPSSFPKKIDLRHLVQTEPLFETHGLAHTNLEDNAVVPDFKTEDLEKFKSQPLKVYGAPTSVDGQLKQCPKIEHSEFELQISEKKSLLTPTRRILSRILREVEEKSNSYLNEISVYFVQQLKLQLANKVEHMFWFRMAGSSVFLEEYGYHLVTSRLAYSPRGRRNNPTMSLVYAQIFDTDWNEVEGASLVVPCHDGSAAESFQAGGANYTLTHYPTVLPIPLWHDYEEPDTLFLGPEDARITLVKNKLGHMEPMLIYNLLTRKNLPVDDDHDDHLEFRSLTYRSMWVAWPWQQQKGKANVDETGNAMFYKKYYTKCKELIVEDVPIQRTPKAQKNWTPLVSNTLRSVYGYDKYISFVYRWSKLQIFHCDISSEEGRCALAYSQDDNIGLKAGVGPLRGGTPMINVKELMDSNPKATQDLKIPEGREIWVGFARAHLKKCGCGTSIYRPNLAVIVKDTVVSDTGEPKDVYRISQLSSFISLKVELFGWEPDTPSRVCDAVSALIPNGISDWNFAQLGEEYGRKWIDSLTLSFSISDASIDFVQVLGVFSLLRRFNDGTLFSSNTDNLKGLVFDASNSTQALAQYGYNDDNIICAMEASKQFCRIYGEMIENKIEDEGEVILDQSGRERHMQDYKNALYELGLEE